MDSNKEIDILRLVNVALRRWYLILGVGVLCALLVFMYTTFLVTPMYSATAQVYISNKVDYSTNMEEVNINDVYSSQALVPVYSTMVRTNMVLDKVANSPELKEAGIEYTAEQLQRLLSTQQEGKTAVLRITVVNPNKEYCAVIANSVATTGVAEIPNVAPGSTAYIMDEAETPEDPYSPSVPMNTVLGFLFGAVLAAVIVVLKDIFDTKLKDEEIFSGIIGVPVLGRIGTLHHAK